MQFNLLIYHFLCNIYVRQRICYVCKYVAKLTKKIQFQNEIWFKNWNGSSVLNWSQLNQDRSSEVWTMEESVRDKFWLPRAYFNCSNCNHSWSWIIPYAEREQPKKCPRCRSDCVPRHIHMRFVHLLIKSDIFLFQFFFNIYYCIY